MCWEMSMWRGKELRTKFERQDLPKGDTKWTHSWSLIEQFHLKRQSGINAVKILATMHVKQSPRNEIPYWLNMKCFLWGAWKPEETFNTKFNYLYVSQRSHDNLAWWWSPQSEVRWAFFFHAPLCLYHKN